MGGFGRPFSFPHELRQLADIGGKAGASSWQRKRLPTDTRPTGTQVQINGTKSNAGWGNLGDRRCAVLIRGVESGSNAPAAISVSERRLPWFWNTAVLARLVWLLLGALFAVYASRVLAQWGWGP